jgi:hypothetical protein
VKEQIKLAARAMIGPTAAAVLRKKAVNIGTRLRRWSRGPGKGRGIPPVELRSFVDPKRHVFFGYHDVSPLDANDTVLLATRTPLRTSSPGPQDRLEIGYFRLTDPQPLFQRVGETLTWCWQQGCRLQWHPLNACGRSHAVIYNRPIGRRYGCCIQDIRTQEVVREFPIPVYALTPDGRTGFSLNFSRLGRLRPGYGYTLLPDETPGTKAPREDGVWAIEMAVGGGELVLSLAAIAEFEPLPGMQDAIHYVNHICANPDGTRICFFHVWIDRGKRFTRMLTCDLDGGRLFPLVNEGHVSHFAWRSASEILCWSTHADTGTHYHLYKDLSRERRIIGAGTLAEDGHPGFAPGGNRFVTDTYPDRYAERHLLVCDLGTEALTYLGSYFSPFRYTGESRCDLHPRWSPSGRSLVFDSAHTGWRGMHIVDWNG